MATTQPPGEPLPSLGPTPDVDEARRRRFEPHELAAVLSHYELGVIDEIRRFPRGSRRAPKVRIRAEAGEFLLKRRAPGRDDPHRVAFAHSLQLFLEDRGYPVTGLVGTRDHNSMLQLQGHIYELFKFVRGERADGSIEATEAAGAALGRLHRSARRFEPPFAPPTGGFHAAKGVATRLAQVPAAVARADKGADRATVEDRCDRLGRIYATAADEAEKAGLGGWPPSISHGDWHPGNLIYRRGRVVAVLDFDSARLEPRVADVANAMLQFSMGLSARGDSDEWAEGLDEYKMRQVLRGYDRAAAHTIGADELRALPWLMIEALVVETVVPIAATGTFGRVEGLRFLTLAAHLAEWIAGRSEALVRRVRR